MPTMLLGRRTPVTSLLLVAIAIGFVAQLAMGRGLIELYANYGPAVRQGEYWRLVTSMFLHGGIIHLALNAWALYQLGSLFEILLGSSRLAGVYLVTGIAGSLASAFWSDVPSVGASGAIFGLLGALISFLLRRRENLTPQAKALLGQLVMWAAINVVFGFSGAANIDNAAHMGGLVAGLAAGLLLREPERHRLAGV